MEGTNRPINRQKLPRAILRTRKTKSHRTAFLLLNAFHFTSSSIQIGNSFLRVMSVTLRPWKTKEASELRLTFLLDNAFHLSSLTNRTLLPPYYVGNLRPLKNKRGGLIRMATYIRCIRDNLPKKDLLVAVESVDDETEQLINLSLEGESFYLPTLLLMLLLLRLLRLLHYHLTSLLLLVLGDDRHRF